MRWTVILLPLIAAACVERAEPTGSEDFATFCSACHGLSGRGDGAAAEDLDQRPADLTRLSARNGGVFPGTAVMAKIWGYTDDDTSTIMPAFRDLLRGRLVPYDGGDGRATPTPVRLVGLAEHLRRLQQ
jgi:mono/diheme cytochrome c family protein